MLPDFIMQVGPDRLTAGAASLTQGIYGARGNLELVACDAHDGLWVFWFNANRPDDPHDTPEVPPGTWSSGLAFAQGRRYTDAQIVQSTLGPDHLEVLALTDDGVLQSWYWSPGPGFQRRETDAAHHVTAFRLEHSAGTLRVGIRHSDGTESALVSTTSGYPRRTFTAAITGPAIDDLTAITMLAAHGIDAPETGTARAARSTRDGGTTELTWRDREGRIRHLGIADRSAP